MGSIVRPFFDLNDPPTTEENDSNVGHSSLPQKSLPTSNSVVPIISPHSESCQNSNGITKASKGSAHPFVRFIDVQILKEPTSAPSSSASAITAQPVVSTVALSTIPVTSDAFAVEREQGEWYDMDGSHVNGGSSNSKLEGTVNDENIYKHMSIEKKEDFASDNDIRRNIENTGFGCNKDETWDFSKDTSSCLTGQGSSRNTGTNVQGELPSDALQETSVVINPRDIKGVEGSHALRFANIPAKRPKLDEHKEAMLGKKRNRHTVFININEVKQAGSVKISTPKRPTFSSSLTSRNTKETFRSNSSIGNQDQKQTEMLNTDNSTLEAEARKHEAEGDTNMWPQERSKQSNANNEFADIHPTPISRQSLSKQPAGMRQLKNQQISSRKPSVTGQNTTDQKLVNKKNPLSKKPNLNSISYQDTSVERLLREVTNQKFWHNSGELDLQCVPGQFESVEEYARVFEPLLLEECRAQLFSTWEEAAEHIMVRVKNVERRERGWYDVIVIPPHETKWTFKEGDVAILSTPRPGAVRFKRNNVASASEEDAEPEVTGRIAGTVRRHSPIDTRDPSGAILHFYVGDSYDYSKADENHFLRKFQPRSVWYLTVLGSLATTQREYKALHAFRHLNVQMQTAILKPSPNHFPKYEEMTPAMPECFTQNFIDHLHRCFNGPQLASIQWAAMHTAAGTTGINKKQNPWPFTLVQGPPGTGKTHTVWGMLNVIHLVQYQHYYAALLKKLAPESYRQANESNYESTGTGSIDELLQIMDQNLFRTLPKLCPKPRMLVCAPSNAATDELLARVLNRGFIDGEMKVYRPDVARVGVDSQTRAAQAVSVEQRTNLLLEKGRDEIIGWMHSLRLHEAQCSQKITLFQRQLNAAAAVGRSQGSVGVDPDVLVARDQNRDVLLQNLAQVVEQRDKILVEMSRLLIVEGKFRHGRNFNIEEARANLEASFANEAEIVFTTVSSSGRKLFSRLTHGFDMIVIDEAAQASEMGILPPLSLGAARCVLVGDPQQLPATVISKAAGSLLYSRSLFERFQQAGCPTMLLSVQYRMHPQIRDFPSKYFYQGRLTDSESVTSLPDEIYYKDPLLQPYMFFDMMHGRESHKVGSVSFQNIHEAQFCLRLYEHLHNFLKANGGNKISVGIITPYKLQLRCIEREFGHVLKSEEGKDLYINTVDAFQGQERDVIIMSCVRASSHGVGFVADVRRMNVALTRARRALWVVGNANALMQSEDWAALITDAKCRKCFTDLDSIPKEFLVLRGEKHTPNKSHQWGLITAGQRHRNFDTSAESNSGIQSEEDKKLATGVPRNGSYRSLKLHI